MQEFIERYRKANPNRWYDGFAHLDELNRSVAALNPAYEVRELDEALAKMLFEAHARFENLAAGFPFPLWGKAQFAEWMVTQEDCPSELLLRFLTDHSFYFAEQRDLGNLPGDGKRILPVCGTDAFLMEDTVWLEAARTPSDLLDEGVTKLEAVASECEQEIQAARTKLEKQGAQEHTVHYGAAGTPSNLQCEALRKLNRVEYEYQQAMQAVREVLERLKTPEPQAPIQSQQVENLLRNRREKSIDATRWDQLCKRLLYPYAAEVENHRRAQKVVEKGWIPTTAHRFFAEQNEQRYHALKQQLQRREDDQRCSERLLRELESLNQRCPMQPEQDRGAAFEGRLKKTIALFERYIHSVLYAVHQEKYEAILHFSALSLEKRPYFDAIHRLLDGCFEDGRWQRLTPLLLYHAFSGSTNVILRYAQGKPRRKLCKSVKIMKKQARVKNMTSMTGRRAAINLVLYHKLKQMFAGAGQVCLLGRQPEHCADTPYRDEAVRKRMVPPHEADRSRCPASCPFLRTAEEYNDWAFALTTGYGMLHHHLGGEDTAWVSQSALLKKRDFIETEEAEEDTEMQGAPEEPKVLIWRYRINYRKPVGVLEGALREQIANCFNNRPYMLTPISPNTYRREEQDPLYAPYQELATLLLQDQHLPAMLRLSRIVKKLLSEHPEYLEEYENFLKFTAPTSMVREFLQSIIREHQLMAQIRRYGDYRKSRQSYHVEDSVQNILEYEIREQLYDAIKVKIEQLAFGRCFADLLLYPEAFVPAQEAK